MKFKDLSLDPRVLQAIEETGYETPTPIQEQAIPIALEGRDVLGIAQTGTGKTASFSLPMITMLAKGRARARMPRSLVLCPTRELAAQVAENFETYAKHVRLTMALLIGGVSFGDQEKKLDRGVDVLIATPGRLIDHFERGKLMLSGIEIMVVDEADRMLDMGFIPDIEKIFKLTPFTRQTLFFSATMPPEITALTDQFLHNPARVEVERASSTAPNIEQRLCMFAASRRDRADAEKREVLRRLMRAEGDGLRNAIIFCNRKRDVAVVHKSLEKHGFNVGSLHGDLDQRVRMQVLEGFRNGAIKLLVASDVAARGLDIPDVSHVVNYDVPIHAEDYVHRIGRTGRAGKSGVAISIALSADQKYVDRIEEMIETTIPRIDSPLEAVAVIDDAAAEDETAAPRRERGKGRARPPRRSRSARDDDPAKVEEAEVAVESAPIERVAPKSAAPQPEPTSPRQPAAREPRRGRGRDDDRDDRVVVGLGDHVPAFLLRPAPIPRDDAA